MIASVEAVMLDCGLVVGAGLVVAVTMRFGRAVLEALPMSRARRAQVGRLAPIAGAILIAVYAVLATRWILESGDRLAWIAFAAVASVCAAGSWCALRDALEGVYLRAARTIAIGDRVQIGSVRGRIQRLGLRAVVIEAIDGELAVVPYRTVAASTLLRVPSDERSSFHVFRMPVPEDFSVPDAKRAVREAALLHHWSSIARAPQVVATDDGHLEITVFPIDADHVTDLERVLRRALTRRG